MALETDPHRLEQRQKQIDFGLATTGYANYVAWLKSNKGRVKPIPIPNIYVKCSKRSWDGQIRHWRRLLHLWDAIELPSGTPDDRHFQDPCAFEDVDWIDPAEPNVPPAKPAGTRPKAKPHNSQSSPSMRPPRSNFQHPNSQQQYATFPVQPMPQSYAPSHQGAPMHHPMHLHHQASYQLPPQMMPAMAPSMHPMGYMYQVPPPGWQLSYVPTGYQAVPSMYTPMEEGLGFVPAPIDFWALLEQEEAEGRSAIWEEETAATAALMYQQAMTALNVANSAHRELAHRPSAGEHAQPWTDSSISLLLNEFASNPSPAERPAASDLLPPSLSEARPGPPESPAAASDTHSLASFVDLSLDEERHHNFRRLFGEASSSHGGNSLESPPPCWSPARLNLVPQRAPLTASTPGLSPSPHEWFATQRSPVQVSPRGALAFADWTSPHPGQMQESKKVSYSAETTPGWSDAAKQ